MSAPKVFIALVLLGAAALTVLFPEQPSLGWFLWNLVLMVAGWGLGLWFLYGILTRFDLRGGAFIGAFIGVWSSLVYSMAWLSTFIF